MNSGLVVEYIRYRIGEDRRVGFEEAYAAASAVLARSPHCVEYDLARSVDEPACHILRITWTSAADHLHGFRTGEPARGRGASVPSLHEWAGGAPALERLTEAFYVKVRRDALIGPLFAHMNLSHPRYVAMWLSEVFGGPDRYTRERGGYAHMLGQHVGKAITEAQRWGVAPPYLG